jgi:hypothetical protein
MKLAYFLQAAKKWDTEIFIKRAYKSILFQRFMLDISKGRLKPQKDSKTNQKITYHGKTSSRQPKINPRENLD